MMGTLQLQLLCSNHFCLAWSAGLKFDYYCTAHKTEDLVANRVHADEMRKEHEDKLQRKDTIRISLQQHLVEQSFDLKSGQDADEHLAQNKKVFHWTTAPGDFEKKWERNALGEIMLSPNWNLKKETLDQYSHFGKKHNKEDPCVWGTTNFIGGKLFINTHHQHTIKKGTKCSQVACSCFHQCQ
mmetsp:Transcript_43308/g.77829  ORF Transcript_43308/g.77829 Transcript_43308/m.77829 type:complete len:184 (+) Transcript_43308:114-665(+)